MSRIRTSARTGAARRPMAAVAALASVGLLAACGSDEGNTNAADTTEETTATTEASDTTDEPQTDGDDADNGSGEAADGAYEGWADMDTAIADLSTQGINCEIPSIEGIDEQLPFAVCDPDGMLSFGLTMADFEEVMEQDVTEGEQITVVSEGEWIFACDSTESEVCDQVAGYTGGEVRTLG